MLAVQTVPRGSRGFTLIELMISIALLGVLLGVAMPSFSEWMQNTRIRSGAESLRNALQLARMEAVRRNISVRFELMTDLTSGCQASTTGGFWVVSVFGATGACDQDPDTSTLATPSGSANPLIVQKSGNEIGSITAVSASQSSIVFSGLGRPTPVPNGIITINLASVNADRTCVTEGGNVRCLRIEIAPGGQVRMCDPSVSTSGDPRICEAA